MTFNKHPWWGTIEYNEWQESVIPETYRRPQIAYPDLEEIKTRAPAAVTIGQEVEQPGMYIDQSLKAYLNQKRGGHYDGSGPFEWGYGPYIYPSQMLRLFFKDVGDRIWEWAHETPSEQGCGSHWHFRPNDDRVRMFVSHRVEYWTIAMNTINEMLPILLPFLIHGIRAFQDVPRSSAGRWASPRYRRWSERSVAEVLANPYFSHHEYKIYEFNGASYGGKPLTIEIRLAETHPIIAAAGQRILSYILNHYFKKLEQSIAGGARPDISPKFTEEGKRQAKKLYNDVVYTRHDLWNKMENYGPVIFQPGRGPTYLFTKRFLKNEYRTFYELFAYTVYEQLALYPEKERNKDWFWRVLWLLYNKGVPAEEKLNLWDAYTHEGDDFQWETAPAYTDRLPKPEEMLS